MANNGGAIHIPNGNTVSATNITFQNNSALQHAGAIWNNGTFTATNCTFTGNSCTDVGAIYNAVQTDDNGTYAGSATLTNCTITGNWGTTGAGALANAVGATVMTIDGCTITDNIAASISSGGGIWNGGTLNMKGAVIVTGNKKDSGVASNVFLKSGKVITVTGSLDGSSIGVEMENTSGGTFTSGYPAYNTDIPAVFFTVNGSTDLNVWPDDNNEACLTTSKTAEYYDTSSTSEPQMKTATNVAAITRNTTSIGTTGKTTWCLVSGTITNTNRITVNGTVNLILEDGCSFTVTKGIRVEMNNTLNIYAQSAGSGCGALIAQAEGNDASIGSNGGRDSDSNSFALSANDAGIISIYGGSITAAAIGGGSGGNGIYGYGDFGRKGGDCQGISIYGGNINATKIGAGSGGRGMSYDEEDPTDYSGQDGSCQNISLSWTDLTDRIHSVTYLGTVTLQKQFLDNNDNTYAAGTYSNGYYSNDSSIQIQGKYLGAFVEKYNITIEGSFNPECLNASAKKAPAGTEITLTAINGYKVSDLTAKDANNQDIPLTDNNDGTWTFTMPASAVTVTPTATRYYVIDFGPDVTLSNVSESDNYIQGGTTYYKSGVTYTFSVNVPNHIYELGEVAIYYNKQKQVIEPVDGTYSFEMPEADVV